MPHVPDRHADHDPLAIAAYAAGDAAGPALDGAIARVAACPDCALLHHDLRAIAAALPTLPAPARPRDFRLTPDEAAALRPAGWRRWLAPLAGPRFAFAGPLGAGLATLGIAGILVAGVAGAPVAPAAGGAWDAAASGQDVERTSTGAAQAAGPAASTAPESMAPATQVTELKAEDLASPATGAAPVGPAEAQPAASGGIGATSDAAAGAAEPAPSAAASTVPAAAAPAAPSAAASEPAAGHGNGAAATAAAPEVTGTAHTASTAAATGTGLGAALPLVSLVLLVAGVALGGLRLTARRLRAAG